MLIESLLLRPQSGPGRQERINRISDKHGIGFPPVQAWVHFEPPS